MTNLSSLSKAQLGIGAIVLLALAGAGLAIVSAPLYLLCAVGVAIVAIAAWAIRRLRGIHAILIETTRIARNVRRGDYEDRVVFLGLKGDMRVLIDEINGTFDVTDAYLREAMLAMKAASEGRFYRRIRLEGLQGSYRQSAIGINAAIEDMSKRQSMDDIAVADIQRLVANAERGQLDTRLDTSRYFGAYRQLAEGMNTLMGTVGSGLAETGTVLSAMAQADLSRRVTGDYAGAFDKLKTDSNAVADKLVDIMSRLKQTSHGVKIATGEILAGANDLSERTTKQAATLEETSATMEQLAQTVMDNAKQASQAHEEAKSASMTAEQGGQAVRAANDAMGRITTSSSKISKIIGLIDDIAFQTNLLALNASVEAARAGEAGKGFAVVAIEVRRLAQSAAKASAEVKALIEQSGNEVAEGTRLVATAADKLAQMLQAVQHNAGQMERIAHDSREQASAIEEINIAVRQMDEMTQHNAALVEETNAAIEQTEARASELDRIVEVFTIDERKTQGRAA